MKYKLSDISTQDLLNEIINRNVFNELNEDKKEWIDNLNREDFYVDDITKYRILIVNRRRGISDGFMGSISFINKTTIENLEEKIGLREMTI